MATVFDLFVANYGLDRGLGGEHVATSYDDDVPYTPAWAEPSPACRADQIITVAREFALNAEKTNGKLDGHPRRRAEPLVPHGHELPGDHQSPGDVRLRRSIGRRLVALCRAGKAAPQTGWLPLAFALDWNRPPRHMNSTSFWYAHTDQWRYETLGVDEILSPTAPEGPWDGALIDYNVRAERMGWLPSAPQLKTNPLRFGRARAAAGKVAQGLCRSMR